LVHQHSFLEFQLCESCAGLLLYSFCFSVGRGCHEQRGSGSLNLFGCKPLTHWFCLTWTISGLVGCFFSCPIPSLSLVHVLIVRILCFRLQFSLGFKTKYNKVINKHGYLLHALVYIQDPYVRLFLWLIKACGFRPYFFCRLIVAFTVWDS
jgi:hypothetical protein